jgi:hypothetical protein
MVEHRKNRTKGGNKKVIVLLYETNTDESTTVTKKTQQYLHCFNYADDPICSSNVGEQTVTNF